MARCRIWSQESPPVHIGRDDVLCLHRVLRTQQASSFGGRAPLRVRMGHCRYKVKALPYTVIDIVLVCHNRSRIRFRDIAPTAQGVFHFVYEHVFHYR